MGFNVTVVLPQNFQPSWFANCTLWNRADLGITIATGVSQWNDFSGQGNNVTQATGSQQPTFNASGGANGQAYLSFVRANTQQLRNSVACINPTVWTIWAVFSVNNASVNQEIICFGTSHGNSFQVDSSQRDVLANGVSARYDGASTTNTEIWIATNDGTTTLFWVNGTATSLTNNTTNADTSGARTAYGTDTGTGSPLDGNIYEGGAYSTNISAAQVVELSQYLGVRYGIVVSGFSPNYIAGCVLWLRADQGVTVVQGAVSVTGTTPPSVTLSGTPTNTSQSTIVITITTLGVVGTALFSWSFNGVTQQTGQTTSISFSLGTTGITADFAGGASIYNVGDIYTSVLTVSQWNDQSGNGNNFTQATSANQPNYNADPIGTYPAIRFTGSPMNMTCVNNIATTAPCTFIAVVRPQSNTGVQAILVGKAFGSYTTLGSGINEWGVYWNANVNSVQLTNGVTYDLIANSHAFNNVDLIANGTLSNQTNGTGAPSRGGTNLGSDPTNVQYLQADIAEVILYSVSLSASQITEIRNYVSARYSFAG